jgi:AcrR family transcriptional regulator
MTTTALNDRRRTPMQERARVTRAAILQATARILEGSEGSEPPSTNRIAKVAGVSIGTLYQYFDSREDILRAISREHAGDMMQMLVRQAGAFLSAPPKEAVPAFVDALAACHAVAPRLHLALIAELMQGGGEALMEIQDPARAFVRAWLEQHKHAIRPKDLDAAAFLLTNTVEAAIHGVLFVDPAKLKDRAWRDELVDLLLRYLVD